MWDNGSKSVMMEQSVPQLVAIRSSVTSQAVATLLLGLSLSAAYCQAPAPPPPNPGPVQAELIAPLNVRHLVRGTFVFARVTLDWKGLGCALRTGATLEATVEAADRRNGHSESQVALAFNRAQCGGPDLKPLHLLLAAVAQPPMNWENAPNASLSAPLLFATNAGTVNPGMGRIVGGAFTIPQMELRGITHRFPMSAKVQPGDVIDIRGMKLGLGTGPNRSSVITTKDRDVSLDMYTQILLVPAALVYAPDSNAFASPGSEAASGSASEATAVPSPRVPDNDLEVCAPPGCAVDLPVTPSELEGRKSAEIPVRPLGYEPRSRQALEDFGDEETLAWLSPSQLLFAFNSHPLIRRTPNSSALRRVIRAVLIDAEHHTVVRAVDWEILDTARYLWPFDGNRILVHVGNELRVYSANLEMEHSIPLAGPLSFVRITPSGDTMAIATLRERHSTELHARLRTELEHEPDEDVDVAILDKELNTIARASTVSDLLPPTLLNEGQASLFSQPNMRYRLALSTWDHKATTLARFGSSCTPKLSSVAPDLLFLLTCSRANGMGEYRVLRANGKVLMRGQSSPGETGQEAIGNQKAGLFAIKVVQAASQLSPGVEFRMTDLESEEVRVYGADDGGRLLTVRVDEPTASHGGYALSPDGAQLAILSQSQIQLIPVPSH